VAVGEHAVAYLLPTIIIYNNIILCFQLSYFTQSIPRTRCFKYYYNLQCIHNIIIMIIIVNNKYIVHIRTNNKIVCRYPAGMTYVMKHAVVHISPPCIIIIYIVSRKFGSFSQVCRRYNKRVLQSFPV